MRSNNDSQRYRRYNRNVSPKRAITDRKDTNISYKRNRNKNWGKSSESELNSSEKKKIKVEKPNFERSGALNEDKKTGKVYKGVVLKWSEPPNARVPKSHWRFYVFKNDKMLQTLYLHRQSAYLIGRHEKICDIHLLHESISKQHCVVQFKLKKLSKLNKNGKQIEEIRPYILDLDSTNGTFVNGEEIPSARYIELKEKDVLKFGESSREYVLLNDKST